MFTGIESNVTTRMIEEKATLARKRLAEAKITRIIDNACEELIVAPDYQPEYHNISYIKYQN